MEPIHKLPLFEQMSSLADGVRSRILLAVENRELTVTELCGVLQLPQSTVSRHLKTLADTGWVLQRPDGTRRLYQFSPSGLDPTAGELWKLARDHIRDTPASREDGRRLTQVLAERRERSREFFDGAAGSWDRVRDALFGRHFYSAALLGLLDPTLRVADLGCGTGAVSEALAPVVGHVVAVDDSRSMLAAAGERLSGFSNVELCHGQLEALPIPDASVDLATLILVLHHLPEPARVLAEVKRVLVASGRVLLVDMLPHQRVEWQQQMGHVWMGFDEEQVGQWLATAGLRLLRFNVIPPDTVAKGPTLFAATASRN